MPVWVVTGGSGFLGSHLLARLATGKRGLTPFRVVGKRGLTPFRVVAVGRRVPACWSGAFAPADFGNAGQVARVVAELRPAVVFHLAGRTPPASPADFDRANTQATLHWLDALRSLDSPRRLVLAGSAAELGPVPVADLPVGEDWPCQPVGDYALSKWRATSAALAVGLPLEVVVARIFNPIGPGLPTSQALGRFARLLASGTGPLDLTVGDLEARRDFVDVRDVAEALLALADRGLPRRVYHVGTGQSHRVGDGLDRLIALSGRPVTQTVDPGPGHSTTPSDSRADITRIKTEVGWSPRIAWKQSLADLWASVGRD